MSWTFLAFQLPWQHLNLFRFLADFKFWRFRWPAECGPSSPEAHPSAEWRTWTKSDPQRATCGFLPISSTLKWRFIDFTKKWNFSTFFESFHLWPGSPPGEWMGSHRWRDVGNRIRSGGNEEQPYGFVIIFFHIKCKSDWISSQIPALASFNFFWKIWIWRRALPRQPSDDGNFEFGASFSSIFFLKNFEFGAARCHGNAPKWLKLETRVTGMDVRTCPQKFPFELEQNGEISPEWTTGHRHTRFRFGYRISSLFSGKKSASWGGCCFLLSAASARRLCRPVRFRSARFFFCWRRGAPLFEWDTGKSVKNGKGCWLTSLSACKAFPPLWNFFLMNFFFN